ncbi:shikimate kinase [Paraburkholderia lacunae]|uniref:Shikimate kinase n=1 Tax=Paraburkholderia lacunae TaxID=2211104 RepID=A0A370N395_9BURK|nr:helix-turn-helix transcriptional regulator [Paraburkholderia lacunae]RDK00094.1 shikimate kinase [Paraburkholderia lacunae]
MNSSPTDVPSDAAPKEPVLVALGERIRLLRARRGMTRRDLAHQSNVSERHLANLEMGTGNASVLVLEQLAQTLGCSLAALVGDPLTCSPEGEQILALLRDQPPAALRLALETLRQLLSSSPTDPDRYRRIALIGLRGAGKSTLGKMLADVMELPFIEITREVERIAGCKPSEVHALYGATAYRRYEFRALEEVLKREAEAVIASPGGLVSETRTFNLLLSRCFTVWLRATPEDHMQRVIDQGDLRPMAGRSEAMDDLRRILAGRSELYARADVSYDTSGKTLRQSYQGLRDLLAAILSPPCRPDATSPCEHQKNSTTQFSTFYGKSRHTPHG